ncbi:hypothetical protein C440_13319 [Haloferax mucosum ATCC BAA-1512]|uniref:Uncharacterized protein n=1 Tax=Haloferax mucosum ATCC BAA-1512 TaxID=662479 RepID=M0I3G3_9EURY|nr:hypothetical protein [Haloferax mucosum]ELZ91296.1 hypothetical protein C440_13319 [Haloferax mucosum ATCC BAA-1512]
MAADKQISVTKETQEELHELKKPGQTYDDPLKELVHSRRREVLKKRFQELEGADGDKLTSLEVL